MANLVSNRGRGRLAPLLLAALAAVPVGCGGDGMDGPMPRFHEPVVARLKRDGFAVRNVVREPAGPYGAKQCVRGEAEKLEVLFCDYGSPEDARAAEKKLSRFAEGAVTGVARSSGTAGMAVADRQKADVKGKRIARLLKAFAGKEAADKKATR